MSPSYQSVDTRFVAASLLQLTLGVSHLFRQMYPVSLMNVS